MMKALAPVLLASLLHALPLAASQPGVPAAPPEQRAVSADSLDVEDFMMHYFQHPEPEKVDALIRAWVALFPSVDDCSAIPATLVFFGEVFKANPDRVEGWAQTVASLPEDWQEIFEWSLRFARGEEGDVAAETRLSPGIFDACWGGFLASGDKKYPECVLRAACAPEPPGCMDLSIRTAAWSCCSFILNYPEMREIARAWFAAASEEQRLNFASRANEEVQLAVFEAVLMSEEQKEERDAKHREEAQELAELRRRTADIIRNYYRTPAPEQIEELIALSARIDPQAEAVNHSMSHMFFAEVFKANPERVEGWERYIASLPQEWQDLLAWSLRFARGEEANPLEAKLPDMEALQASTGGFLATGDGRYLEFQLRVGSMEGEEQVYATAARAMATCVRWHEPALQLARDWFAKASEEQRLTFARRVDEESQQLMFGEVLVPQGEVAE